MIASGAFVSVTRFASGDRPGAVPSRGDSPCGAERVVSLDRPGAVPLRHAESEFNPQPHREVLRVLECDPQCKTISAATSVPPPLVRDQSGFQDCEAPVITLHCQSMTARVTLDQAAVASLDQAAFRPGHRAWKAKFTFSLNRCFRRACCVWSGVAWLTAWPVCRTG